ncbi:MAG: heat-inducible transcription repressor HrcA [Clostridia bacterium]|nr:heat-inducible transcription repressor HrcA [Clostridia bacterium]MBO5316402.1 heat-inducible transcription repressor HrcA [Clostridia bacterium]MBR3805904.1 heat-inducible transcription repressor HrcA [Clostridia bacterium]
MDDSRLTPRKMQILKAIVDAHIAGGEPVGSKYLSQDISCSPATIRNEMAELEDMGYLIQPHTSAGRVPSELGYKYYVNSLVAQYASTKSEIDEINQMLRYKLTEMDEIMSEISRLAASFTDYTGIAFKSGTGKVRVAQFKSVLLNQKDFLLIMSFEGDIVKTKTIHLSFALSEDILRRFTEALNMYLINLTSDAITMPIIVKLEALMGSAGAMVHPVIKVIYETMSELDSADVKLDGVTNLLQYPEYSDVSDFRDLLGVLEEKEKLMDVISTRATGNDDIHVYIGTDNETDAMKNTTLIFKNVTIGGKTLSVGVIGPKRMNYSKVIDMLNKLTGGLDRLFTEDALPPGYDKRD